MITSFNTKIAASPSSRIAPATERTTTKTSGPLGHSEHKSAMTKDWFLKKSPYSTFSFHLKRSLQYLLTVTEVQPVSTHLSQRHRVYQHEPCLTATCHTLSLCPISPLTWFFNKIEEGFSTGVLIILEVLNTVVLILVAAVHWVLLMKDWREQIITNSTTEHNTLHEEL